MADTILLKSLKSQPKLLNLNNKKLDRVPKAIGRLMNVLHVEIKNNKLKSLPIEFGELVQVSRSFVLVLCCRSGVLIRGEVPGYVQCTRL